MRKNTRRGNASHNCSRRIGGNRFLAWLTGGGSRSQFVGKPRPVGSRTYAYFTAPEIAFLDAAVSRLIPADDLGPGAKEAGVTFFIDQQMAGPFGRGETWYMQGPWKDGTEQQGYQLKLTPAQLYRVGIQAADDYCRRTFKKNFAELGAADQDKVLRGLEKGEIELAGAPAKEFFSMLWQNTGEGFFADPIYGGQPRFCGLETGRLSGTALQLRQRNRAIRQTVHAAHGGTHGTQRNPDAERLSHDD